MIELKNATKIYEGSDYKTVALEEVNLTIKQGDFIAVMGPSGSGKTTLLNIIGCMDSVTGGTYLLNGTDASAYKYKELSILRKNYISFIFQNFALMPNYTVYENVEIPLLAKNIRTKKRKKIILEKLEELDIRELANKLPSQISGGQQQRAAIARALVTENPVILADEPTGALDRKTGMDILGVFEQMNDNGKTVILITHDELVAKRAKRIIKIVDGRLEEPV